ncbi:MAG: tetratricopeptide repeat protein [Bryobacteraceae bacterium]
MKPRRAPRRRSADRQSTAAPATPAASIAPSRYLVFVSVALAVAALLVYWQTASHGFISYDDDQYVYENSHVRAGLTFSNIAWAFTTFFYANWHPVTWLSHMLDCQLFGLNAGYHHLVSVGFHIAGTILLLLVLWRATRRLWPSAIVAAIFALHPMHVESVAWVSERKDVLSAFFGMLALWLYVRYAEAPTVRRYLWVALAFALGLMAKPMLVTFPFVLLLLDYWPLGRLKWPPKWAVLRPLLWEKAPLLALAAIDSVLTFDAQRNFGAVVALGSMPFSARLANVAAAYVGYLGKAVWPADLAVLYPVHGVPAEMAAGAAVLMLALTGGAVWAARRRPYVLVGWLWYVGMLVPVIGLVQVGVQSMADRYTYVPFVGLSIAVVWGVDDLVRNHPALRKAAAGVAMLAVILLAAVAYRQAACWKDSETLFEHTLAVTQGNYIIQNNLGVVLSDEGKHQEAVAHFQRALAILADYVAAHGNLGHEWMKMGNFEKALPELNETLRLAPTNSGAQDNLGVTLAAGGRLEEAREHLEKAVRLAPANPEPHSNLCYVLGRLGRADEAIAQCREALRLKPEFPDADYNLGNALAAQGKKAEARAEFAKVLAANPSNAAARLAMENLGK